MSELEKTRPKGATLYELQKVVGLLPQAETPLTHYFASGVYVREMFIPKGTLIIGKRHRDETINILLKGSISIFIDEDGEIVGKNGKPATKRLDAPMVFISPPYSKKMGYAHEDTIFLNCHSTDTRDLELIEQKAIITEEEYMDLIGMGHDKKLIQEVA